MDFLIGLAAAYAYAVVCVGVAEWRLKLNNERN